LFSPEEIDTFLNSGQKVQMLSRRQFLSTPRSNLIDTFALWTAICDIPNSAFFAVSSIGICTGAPRSRLALRAFFEPHVALIPSDSFQTGFFSGIGRTMTQFPAAALPLAGGHVGRFEIRPGLKKRPSRETK
jgi:hypothetical protein